MGKKIIIDEEVLAKISELIGDLDTSLERDGAMQVQQLILENSTTISIDESIEQNFETLLDTELNKLPYEKHLDDGGYNDGQIAGFERGARFMFDKFATEHSIISEIKSNWISVKDSLPKKASFVIAHKGNGLTLGLYYNADNEFMYGEIDQTSQVTHWMPLPTKP